VLTLGRIASHRALAARSLQRLAAHLARSDSDLGLGHAHAAGGGTTARHAAAAAGAQQPVASSAALQAFLDGEHAQIRRRIKALIDSNDAFRFDYSQSIAQHRASTQRW
jgi:hypothetical protein